MKTDNEEIVVIAKFMDIPLREFNGVMYICEPEELIDFKGEAESYSPNLNWNQLMPVVEKIDALPKIDVEIYPRYSDLNTRSGVGCRIRLNNKESILVGEKDRTRIEIVYKAVVEFIKWYNQQK